MAFASPAFNAIEPLEARQLLSVDVAINTAQRFQTIDGFGTSLGGGTGIGTLKDKRFEKMYWQDLGVSMFRADLHDHVLRAKDGNYATPVYMGPNLQRNIRLMDFDNYNVLINGVLARSALKYAGDDVKVIGSIWTPPYWMKGQEVDPWTGKPNGVMPWIDSAGTTAGGSLIDTPANLTQFGRYVAAYVKGFEQSFGTPMYAVSIQNELAFHESYSSCVYSPQLYVDAIKAVDHWFKVYGITTKIMGPEDVGVGDVAHPSLLKRQMAYINAVRNDPVANAAVSTYAIHGYANDGVNSQRSPQRWSDYWNGVSGSGGFTGIKADHRPSWMTETSGGFNTWATAMRMTGNLMDALVQGNVSAWVYWGITATQSNQTGYTLMTNADPASTRYVAAKHFFKFIRPGAQRVATTGNDPTGVYTAAFVDDKNKTLTAELTNMGDDSQTVHLSVPGTVIRSFDVGYESTETKEWVKLRPVTLKNGMATITLPAKSIITLQASTAVKLAPGAISGTYFHDTNGNGRLDTSEKPLGGDKIYLDTNLNGVYDAGEPKTTTNAKGGFAFTGLAPGAYIVRRDVPAGWKLTTAVAAVTVNPKKTTGVLIGATQINAGHAAITGFAFNDTNLNGIYDSKDSAGAQKTIFLDTNDNGVLDAGETSVRSNNRGIFTFVDLQPGTYYVARVYPTGYRASTPAVTVTIAAGRTFSSVAIGSRTT